MRSRAVRYPILPKITLAGSRQAREQILEIRHSSLYCPRDFDISPYFNVVKPTIRAGLQLQGAAMGRSAAARLTMRAAASLVPQSEATDAEAPASSPLDRHLCLPMAVATSAVRGEADMLDDVINAHHPDVLAAAARDVVEIDPPGAGADRRRSASRSTG